MIHVAPSILSSFVTLLATIGPIETGVIFASLTTGTHRAARASLAFRSTTIAGIVLLLFALAGNLALDLLHISLPAFRVAGGLLLFLQALSLTFSGPGLSSISERERLDAEEPGDIAVFPLAFPLIAGPGGMAAVVLLMGRTQGALEGAGVVAMIAVCLILTYGAMRAADRLVLLLGRTGADVVRRIAGVLLAGLAVQFIFDGLQAAPFLR
ncbi:MarC family protein [Sphingomonas asaccharolytica]|uniref:MarC family protein n=1 Tax=Sphingomonas asaccharolytica TaxID=40681 RepID=UPI000AD0F090|nr:MarC family protein [Sphingomonas asaccharolytica]